MGLALRRLLKRPLVLLLRSEFVEPSGELLRLPRHYPSPRSSSSSREISLVSKQSVYEGSSEVQEAALREGCDASQDNPSLVHKAVIRRVLPKREGNTQQALSIGGAVRHGSNAGLDHATGVVRPVYAERRADIRNRLSDWHTLHFESSVDNHDPASGLQLVDEPRHRGNFRIWVELLRFRQRLFGAEGVAGIWEGIKRRNLDLPVLGPEADQLWGSFIALGIERPKVLDEVYIHAQKVFEDTGTGWNGLYRNIVGLFIAKDSQKAYWWHRRLMRTHCPDPDQLRYIFNQALKNIVGLGVFQRIYLDIGLRTSYAYVIARLCELKLYDIALKWHYLLLRMKDLPSNSDAVEPLLKHVATYGKGDQLGDLTRSLIDAGVPFTSSTSRAFEKNPIISREIMNRMLGEAHSITPKTFSDEFCARLFATRAFSVNTVLSGLRMLGMEAIGPLSLREIASRDGTTRAVAARMDQLKDFDISIGTSTFSKLVKQLALGNKQDLLTDLLSSDQHPDTLEDRNFQESLLASYHKAQNWRKFNSTMAILTSYSRDDPSTEKWNLMLRTHLRERSLPEALQTLEDMRIERVPVLPLSNNLMRAGLLRPRKVGRRPNPFSGQFDDLGYIIGLWQGVLRGGGYVPPLAWREVFRRLGQTGRLKEFEKLVLWLVVWYSPNGSVTAPAELVPIASHPSNEPRSLVSSEYSAFRPTTLSAYDLQHPYRIMLSDVQQEAIIAWGFQTLAQQSSTVPWTWGLRLLLKLREQGVVVLEASVRSAVKDRFKVLFGTGRSAVPVNRLAQANNPHSLQDMTTEITSIWPTLLQKPISQLPSHARRKLARPSNVKLPLLGKQYDRELI
ncbi:hypothetical protein MMC16_003812 [Acarospora aff. strigata]|nr:hypothetical protein [Acarospora aff. strigata]